MSMITDARGNAFSLSLNPRRIVSLVPSTTETIYKLGLRERLVGVTRYCIHPETAIDDNTVVGGTKQINMEKLLSCRPDIVIGNQEENSPELVEQIQANGIPFYVAFPKDVDEALQELNQLGQLLHAESIATHWTTIIEKKRQQCSSSIFRYAYLIWKRPWMALNEQTFISSMLSEIGGYNIFTGYDSRYFQCTLAEIAERKPDVVFLSSEPFPFQEKHKQPLYDAGFSARQIHCIDGAMCSWHGVRMAQAFPYLQQQRAKWL